MKRSCIILQRREKIRCRHAVVFSADLVQSGDYYRLTDPFENQDFVLWEIVSKDRSEAVIKGVKLKSEHNARIHLVYARGLDANAIYKDVKSGAVYSGAALMKAGLPLPLTYDDYQPVEFFFRRIS